MSRHSNIQQHAQEQDHPQPPAVPATRTALVSQDARSRATYIVTLVVVVMLAATGIVAANSESPGTSPPNRTSPPSITGAPVEGATMTADGGAWSGPSFTLGYQWVRCDSAGENCLAVEHATKYEYLLAAADVGSTMRVAVIATNKNGSTVATSDATPVIAAGGSGARTSGEALASPASMQLVFSTSNRRTAAAPLEGTVISGDVYVFTAGDANTTAPVRFFLDEEPDGTPYRVENNAPFDLAGGSADLANAWSTGAVASGRHWIVAVDAAGQRAEASFSVAAASSPSDAPVEVPQAETPQAATPPSASLQLVFSTSSRRTAAAPLDGKSISGTVYVFTVEDASTNGPVRFFFDEEPDGTPYRVEKNAPYDFAGGSKDVANAWNTTGLPSGHHRIVAVDGAGQRADASFAVGEAEVPEPPAGLQLAVSTSSRRTDAGPLDGITVRGSVYVFTAGNADERAPVRFFLDEDPDGTPYRVESTAPYDLAGGSVDLANAWNTGTVPTGRHRIVALDAAGLRAEASFMVADDPSLPPSSGNGTVHYRQDWEYADDDGIDSQQWGKQCDNIAGEPIATRGVVAKLPLPGQGLFSGRFTLPPNDASHNRSACELLHSRRLGHGTHDYYSLALRFPGDWREPSNAHWGMAVFQPNYQGIKGPAVGLFAHSDHVNLVTEAGFCDSACTYRTGNGVASGPLGTHYAIPRGRFGKDVWHELVMHVFWTSDPSKGLVEVWHRRKGESQWVRTAHLTNLATVQWRAGYDPTGDHGTTDKIGAYRGDAEWSISVYHDAWSRATTFDAATAAFSS